MKSYILATSFLVLAVAAFVAGSPLTSVLFSTSACGWLVIGQLSSNEE